MPRSAEQISRRAAKKRERAVLPADRLPLVRLLPIRLDSDKATTRDRRAAETPPSHQAIGWVPLRLNSETPSRAYPGVQHQGQALELSYAR